MSLNSGSSLSPRRLSVAPMMDYTDRHDRYFLRLISKHAWLYTEMVTAKAILHGDQQRLLGFHESENPIALQLGGSDATELARSARFGENYGYDEINLNVGCPSDRVKSGQFGACLMASPGLVADCVSAMANAVKIPVTVKTRIGIDEHDSYDYLCQFIETVAQSGCETFIVHARKAWLQGLSPKQNREVPPLRYDYVYQLKKDYPQLEVIINGGVTDLSQSQAHLDAVDGVMIGRSAYHEPYILAEVDSQIYGDTKSVPTREDIIQQLMPYVETCLSEGVPLKRITRHILGLYHGQPGARLWRRHLSENAHKPNMDGQLILDALKLVESHSYHQ